MSKQFSETHAVDGLSKFTIGIYGTGHVFNDLAAACWFNYLLYYLTEVLEIGSAAAGGVLFAGQITDGIMTPIVGLFSDKYDSPIGKRKPWYILGTIIVAVAFGFIWEKWFVCVDDAAVGLEIFWYAFFASFFNVGWACVQISHMSMIPQLSPHTDRRNILIGLRTAFTYISNFMVLAVAFILFVTLDSPSTQFVILSIIVLITGLVLNIMFITFLPEKKLTTITAEIRSSQHEERGQRDSIHETIRQDTFVDGKVGNNPEPENIYGTELIPEDENRHLDTLLVPAHEEEPFISWRIWLSQKAFYPVGLTYMLTRLANNVSMSLMPFYLTIYLHAGGVSDPNDLVKQTPWQLAVIPLVEYVASISASLLLEKMGTRYSRQKQFFAGMIFTAVGSVPMFFLTPELIWIMFPVAIWIGAGFSLQLSNSMGYIADFIGPYGKSGAFVYGVISLFDKFASGIALFLLLSLGNIDSQTYLRIVVPGIPLWASVGAFLVTKLVKRPSLRQYLDTLAKPKESSFISNRNSSA